MKASGFLRNSILVVFTSSTLIASWPSQSRGQLPNILKPAAEVFCTVFCNEPTQFTNGDPPQPTAPPTMQDDFYYRSIKIQNKTSRKILLKAMLHVKGNWQNKPGGEMIWIIDGGEEGIIWDGTKPENKITGKNFMLLVYDENRRIWNPNSRFFISPRNGGKFEYKEVIMDDSRDFVYPIIENTPPKQPWIFPIPIQN